MALLTGQFENKHARDAQTPGEWRLILSPKPSAALTLFSTLPPELHNGVTIKKYSTRFGYNYEEWIEPNGVTTWWKLIKIRTAQGG